jgi:hypothetical protein
MTSFATVRQYIEDKNYGAARQALIQMGNHPKARAWLQKLETLEREAGLPSSQSRSTLPPPPQQDIFAALPRPLEDDFIPSSDGYGCLKLFGYLFMGAGALLFALTVVIALLPSAFFVSSSTLVVTGFGTFSILILIVGGLISMEVFVFGLLVIAFTELVNNSRAQRQYLEQMLWK